jgi:hypothetical protein
MLGPSPHQGQAELLKNPLAHQLNPQYPLYLLARMIPWKKLEESFAPLSWDGLTEPPHEKNGCPLDTQTPLPPQR